MGNEKGSYLCLVTFRSPQGERTHLVEKSPFIIGRSQNVDLLYPHSSASREHVEVRFDGFGIFVKDKNSVNGTYYKEEKLQPDREVEIMPSFPITIGSGDERLYFTTIPKPVELQSPERQKQILNRAMSEVISGLADSARVEFETEMKAKLEHQHQQSIHTVEIEASELRKQMQSKLANEEVFLKEKQAANLTLQRKTFEQELQQLQTTINHQQAKLRAIEEKITADMARADMVLKNVHEKAEQEYQELKAKHMAHLETQRKDLSGEIKALEEEIHAKTLAARSAGEKVAEQMLVEAQTRLEKQEEDSLQKIATLSRDAHLKMLEASRDARTKADEIIQSARADAQKMRSSSQAEATQARKKALQQAEEIVKQAHKDVEEKVRLHIQEHQQALAKQREDALNEIQEVVTKKQDEIIKSKEQELEKTTTELETLQGQKVELDSSVHELTRQYQNVQTELTELRESLEQKKQEFEELLKRLNDAEATIRKADIAAQDLDRAKQELQTLTKQIDQHKASASEKEKILEAEYKKRMDQLSLEHESHRLSTEQELNKLRAQAQEDIKKQILTEEGRIREARKQQANEIARTVEVRLADTLQTHVPDANQIGVLSQAIFNTVREALVDDSASLKPLTSHLDKRDEKKEMARKKLIRNGSIAASAAAVVILGINYQAVVGFFRGQDQKNNVAKQMIEQRRIQSVYHPDQNNEFRDNYTDNILYMKHYAEVKLNSDYQQKWTLRLNDLSLIKEMKISEEQMIKFIAIEQSTVTQLVDLRDKIDAVYLPEGLDRMHKLEDEENKKMTDSLNGSSNVVKIRRIEKEFIRDYVKTHASEFP